MQKFENHEQMKEYVEKERKRLEERKKIKKEIVSNDNYINWLESFTNKYYKFRDDDFIYNKHDLTDDDLENVNNLSLLYSGINDYATGNYIYPFADSDFVYYYKIKYNNIGYEIGVITGRENLYFCEKNTNIDDSFIDFNDIILNTKSERTEYIEKRLLQLSNIIKYFYEEKIPLNAIKSTINDTISNIENTSYNKIKTLRR